MFLRHFKWKTLAILAAVLAVGVVGLCLSIGKMRERKAFVSKVTAGYRYRCTLSTDWKLTPNSSHTSISIPENYAFSASPSPIREWIAIHLLHQPPATRSLIGRPQLTVGTETGEVKPYIKIQSGYPELDFGPRSIPGLKVLPGRHFRIDNCPATMVGVDIGSFGIAGRETVLLVCTPDYTNTYFVVTVAVSRYSDQAEREMQAILSSFHVEKVAVPRGGK